jgi:tetratricopeptide (TPR) repeat protein
MASIFLSYAREDLGVARSLAGALERLGYSVWWDRHIKGATQFAAEIESALAKAEAVIVLWSQASIGSPWVRDEASAARDSGRLVPASLDGAPPPMGFRQYQSVDLNGWKGRRSSKRFAALVEALDGVLAGRAPRETAQPTATTRPAAKHRLFWMAAFAAALIFAAVTATWLWRSAGTPDEPRIAISPADGSVLSRQVAHDLALALPNLSGGNSSAYELIDAADARSAKADLVLTVGASSSGNRERRDLSLRASTEAILWSASVDQPSMASANLPQQLAVQAQRALSCAAEALSHRRESIGLDTLKLYLSGCTNFDNAYGTGVDRSEQVKLFERVLAKAPHFEPAWAKLIATETDDLMSAAEEPRSLGKKIDAQITQAQKLGLDFAEIYAAKAITRSPEDFVGILRTLDEGIRRHPDSDILHRYRSERFLYVGRMNDSVDAAARAVQLNPLSPANQQNLASAYAYSGNAEAGFAQLRKAEQLWPGAPTIIGARGRLELRYGDPKVALSVMQDPNGPGAGGQHAQLAAFIRARLDPTPANIELAIAEAGKFYERDPAFPQQLVQTLAQFGRKDEVLDILLHYSGGRASGLLAEVLFRPALRDVWRDPRSMAAAARLGLLHYWKISGFWPDFCLESTLPYDCKKEGAKYRA